ncbi:hypothetical protein vBVpP1_54 [Vibrio phage vB_VpP_1]|nr:hypothetical protein vBVpP1_54 [Vibrio phage vB_VpP_1]
MFTFLIIASFLMLAYLLIGAGFALASWLQAAEEEVKEGVYTGISWEAVFWFVVAWPFLAVYCYRTEVSKTIKPLDLSKFKKDK